MHNVGDFKIESGRVYISDPCYEKGTWCQGLIDGVKNGTWNAFIDNRDEGRPGLIRVVHNSVQNQNDLEWASIAADIGVDSGQAGIFDAQHYRSDASIPADFQSLRKGGLKRYGDEEGELFYAACCDRTLGPTGEGMRVAGYYGGGTIPFGAVASSGYGDGSYVAEVAKNEDGEIIAIQIEFISEDDDEEVCDNCGETDCCGDCEQEIDDGIANMRNILGTNDEEDEN